MRYVFDTQFHKIFWQAVRACSVFIPHERYRSVCINKLIQENTHVHWCLVAEEPAGVFHSHGAGARVVRATDKKKKKERVIENLC